MGSKFWLTFAVVTSLLLPVLAFGSMIQPTSYDLLNGQTGSWNYRDQIYTPASPNNFVDMAPLSGGVGYLTDGITPAGSWQNVAGVGWLGWVSIAPSITFNFAGTPTINEVRLFLDNTPGFGDVRLPLNVVIGANTYAINADDDWGPRWVEIPIVPTTASSLELTLNEVGGKWIMLGEAQFEGQAPGAVPEPSTFALLGLGLAAAAFCRRRLAR